MCYNNAYDYASSCNVEHRIFTERCYVADETQRRRSQVLGRLRGLVRVSRLTDLRGLSTQVAVRKMSDGLYGMYKRVDNRCVLVALEPQPSNVLEVHQLCYRLKLDTTYQRRLIVVII